MIGRFNYWFVRTEKIQLKVDGPPFVYPKNSMTEICRYDTVVETSLYHLFNSILIDLIDENDFSVITTVGGKVDGELAMLLSQLIIAHLWWQMFFSYWKFKVNIYLGWEIYLFNFYLFFLCFWFQQFSIFAYKNQISNLLVFIYIDVLWCLRIIIFAKQ